MSDHGVWEVERDRYGVMFSGPLEVGECIEVVPVGWRQAAEGWEQSARELARLIDTFLTRYDRKDVRLDEQIEAFRRALASHLKDEAAS